MFDNFGKPIQEVSTPALVVDADKLDYNIQLKSEYIRETNERRLSLGMGREDITIMKLSEEHANGELERDGAPVRPGEKYNFIPSRCCTTVNLCNKLVVCRKGLVEAIWPISARRA